MPLRSAVVLFSRCRASRSYGDVCETGQGRMKLREARRLSSQSVRAVHSMAPMGSLLCLGVLFVIVPVQTRPASSCQLSKTTTVSCNGKMTRMSRPNSQRSSTATATRRAGCHVSKHGDGVEFDARTFDGDCPRNRGLLRVDDVRVAGLLHVATDVRFVPARAMSGRTNGKSRVGRLRSRRHVLGSQVQVEVARGQSARVVESAHRSSVGRDLEPDDLPRHDPRECPVR